MDKYADAIKEACERVRAYPDAIYVVRAIVSGNYYTVGASLVETRGTGWHTDLTEHHAFTVMCRVGR